MNPLLITDLGLISWTEAYALQLRLIAARKAGAIDDVFLLCEHPHVITLGRNANRANLLASEHVLRQKGVDLQPTNRGGDVTYHGPGQIVGYPILNLNNIKRDVGWYVRTLEEIMIRASSDFGIVAVREPGKTGAWVKGGSFTSHQSLVTSHPTPISVAGAAEKLGAIGVRISRWVTSHGFAYNVSTDLRYFDLIVPCGIADRKATSLEKLLGRSVSLDEAKPRLAQHLSELLGLSPRPLLRDQLLAELLHAEAAIRVNA
jgi:lipoyl(octanoyl) transferase